jgi:arylsulfatase A-like enzyme
MQPKQREMDKIIEKIHKKLIENDKKQEKPTLFLFCSDHGMNEVWPHCNNIHGKRLGIMVVRLRERPQRLWCL